MMPEERRKNTDRRTEDGRRQIKESIPKVFDRREEERRSGPDRRDQDKEQA